MADKSSRLLLDALGLAAAEPGGLALFAAKNEPGLFPASAHARIVADRCKAEGYLQVVRSEARGKVEREICVLTESGRDYLLQQSSPKQVLEDFVRVLEARQQEVESLSQNVRELQQSLVGIQRVVEAVLPRLQPSPEPAGHRLGEVSVNGTASHAANVPATLGSSLDGLIADIKESLAEWRVVAGASQDCPLPELYRKVDANNRASIGRFHDALRQLHEETQICLHPWTGPLYALPEPAFALLVGHEIAYYASVR